tara:strand:+ start:934 stop:1227 length:294 start_codon:yes stop_codon:yes gene_type:complete
MGEEVSIKKAYKRLCIDLILEELRFVKKYKFIFSFVIIGMAVFYFFSRGTLWEFWFNMFLALICLIIIFAIGIHQSAWYMDNLTDKKKIRKNLYEKK